MGGLGYMLGGALAGYGQGMAEVAKSAEEERKQMALENLRQQNQKAMQQSQYDLADRNDARSTERETNKTIQINEKQAEITAKRDKTLHSYEIQTIDRRGSQETAQLRLRASLDAANTRAQAEFQAKLDSGNVERVLESPDGYVVIYKDGRREKTDIKPMPTSSDSGTGTTLVEELQAGKGRAAPAAAPKPAAPPPPPRQARGQAPARPAAAKTYTQADAAATAKQHGISIAQVHERMKSAGYKLTN